MGHRFTNKFNKTDSSEVLKVQNYIKKYIKELQRHFDVPNRKMRMIIYNIYKELSPFNTVKILAKKMFTMIKSKYKNIKIKRN